MFHGTGRFTYNIYHKFTNISKYSTRRAFAFVPLLLGGLPFFSERVFVGGLGPCQFHSERVQGENYHRSLGRQERCRCETQKLRARRFTALP